MRLECCKRRGPPHQSQNGSLVAWMPLLWKALSCLPRQATLNSHRFVMHLVQQPAHWLVRSQALLCHVGQDATMHA